MKRLILKEDRDKSLRKRHPWIYSGALAEVQGDPQAGDTVAIYNQHGECFAQAAYSPTSQIRARVWSWQHEQTIDEAFFRQRLQHSITWRKALLSGVSALRLVNAEADGLPGLIVDCYGDILVVQLLTVGVERWRELLCQLLIELTGIELIYERSDSEVRKLEGLEPRCGFLAGDVDADVGEKVLHEADLTFVYDIKNGHKTGFYLDQRANRARVAALAQDRNVLDCFCYSAGFAVSALAAGASSACLIDRSNDAMQLARHNIERNGLASSDKNIEYIVGDVFKQLRRLRDQARYFDLIIVDPPKFAPTAAQVQKAARAYKDINLWAFKLLAPGGLLATFSCSAGVDSVLFHKIVAGAALDAGRDARIIEYFHAPADHPVALHFPQGEYLKGLLCAVTN